jgi:hypothetical protein
MSNSFRVSALIALAALASSLTGCGTINANLAAGISDYVPHWAGGLPADAPPRPGTAKYDEYMKERERKRLETAAPKEDADKSSASSLDAVH